jgi:hypothetical protein
MKKITLLLLLTSFVSFGQWNQLGSDINGLLVNEQTGTSISLNSDGTILAVSAPRAMDNGVMKGKVRVFEWNNASWIQKGSDIVGSAQGDIFGESISISTDGNVLVIGAPNYLNPAYLSPTGPTGYVRVFEWNGSDWMQRGTDISGDAPNDVAGSSVSLNANGTIIGISFPGFDGGNGANSGAIRIYEWNDSEWMQKGQDIVGPTSDAYIGNISLNASGNIVAIGDTSDDTNGTNAGNVKIYEFNGTTWIQKGSTISGNTTLQGHGSVLAIDDSGTTLITGGFSFTNGAIGYAIIYTWNGTNWIQKGQTLLSNIGSDFFGTSVDISADGSIIGVGGLIGSNNTGHARIYKFISNSWVQQGNDILGEISNDQFGRSLRLSSNGSIVAIGTPFNDGNGTNTGHVRVFENTTLSTPDFDTNTISFYPNPVKDVVHFSSSMSTENITLYNVLGQEVLFKSVNSEEFILDMNNMSSGTYVGRLNSNEKSQSVKIIKL